VVISRIVRANKILSDKCIDTVSFNPKSTNDKLMAFFQENKGKYFPIGEILVFTNVKSGGHSSNALKTFIHKGLLKVRDCECHRTKMYMMP
jgi:hypothetical protein